MGKAASKISNITGPSVNTKDFHPEFDYRTKNLKRLRDSFKAVRRSLTDAMLSMESTPQRLKDVGSGYTAVMACMNYGGGGGSAAYRVENSAEFNEDSAPPSGAQPTRMDRELADESFQASKKFCEAMETLSTTVYPRYRSTLQTNVAQAMDEVIAMNDRTMGQSKKTTDAMARYLTARKLAMDKEKAGAKSGKDLLSDPHYTKLVSDRDTKERVYHTELDRFDTQYEETMALTQKFAAASTEIFLDSVVGYYREMVETIDFTETPTRSKTRSRSNGKAMEVALGEGHDPSDHTTPGFVQESHEPMNDGDGFQTVVKPV